MDKFERRLGVIRDFWGVYGGQEWIDINKLGLPEPWDLKMRISLTNIWKKVKQEHKKAAYIPQKRASGNPKISAFLRPLNQFFEL